MSNTMPAAVLSSDGKYRYFLSRTWNEGGKVIAFIGLNPSTADATHDDPTIRRCTRFAKDWGGGALWMVNLFALRATQPRALFEASDPIGSDNESWLDRAVDTAELTVAAWGNHGVLMNRAASLAQRFHGRLCALGMTKQGMPRHPLYVRADTVARPYVMAEALLSD
jgi:hypothetical protein